MATNISNDDTQANYEQTYKGFYLKFYDELEQIAKDFFIINYKEELTHNAAHNDFNKFLWNDFRKDIFLPTHNKLNELHYLFSSNLSRYKSNRIQKVFKNIVRPAFNKIDLSNLPEAYNLIKFIEEVAFIQSTNEISRLLACNNSYFEKIYDSNRFDFFEIRDYLPLANEDYPHYKEMVLELVPEFVKNESRQINDFVTSNFEDKLWFKTGLKLATGEAFFSYEKYKKDKGHFTKICLELGFKKTDRPYFSATIQNNDTDKNTFANKDKLQKLHRYLTENNLNFGTDFLAKYNTLEPE